MAGKIALRALGLLVVAIALPAALFAKDAPQPKENRTVSALGDSRAGREKLWLLNDGELG